MLRIRKKFVWRVVVMEMVIEGRSIKATAEHPFYVEGKGWTEAHYLEIGDQIRTMDGAAIRVVRLSQN